ncbi:type I-D CRISPR-associated protein Cas7/Csc2 [Clostridium estertheticum]|uniref:type I-D CRISPR-associated protein Cas7/Csc2 n=1 Tax=Clostridium estertheticum TaxID=238834 RepID=UPI001C6E0596|nr:type I-D CRISPR-associated protein Cas7/Csc2 [Clostridium estertheticum]MBW9152361.1 type I-D CRISPR-associated protein Cas7/Csc2 [Clostridium estertheticum]WLC82784.1 type I-D CRISPR-associated protein Cas7/Csc2 [Clostridium estertheticum]
MKREDIIKGKENNFMEKYTHFPEGKYITVAVLREAKSECIFRTEGSGEGLNKERVPLGMESKTNDFRAIISKRKQCAVERRTGREYLRLNDLLFTTKDKSICALNKNTPCGKCLDCMTNGFAVGDGGAQKSRMIYDNAYSILPFNMVTGVKTFNALYDNGTMRDEKGNASSSINQDEYIKPGTVFMDMITFKDVTFIEFIYGISNILRSKRYGAISSRIGKMNNVILKVAFSDCELFSNLELTQSVYDKLAAASEIEFPLEISKVKEYAKKSFGDLQKGIFGNVTELNDEELNTLLEYIKSAYQEDGEEKAADLYREQSAQYGK